MKKSVLQYVQDTLSLMSSDEVDSVNDTVESLQVAHLLRDLYLELVLREEWDFRLRPVQIVAAGTPSAPTRVTLPDNVDRVHTIKYNVSDNSGSFAGRELVYVTPEVFTKARQKNDSSNHLTIDGGMQFYVGTDRDPTCYTTFDDNVLYLNSYDSSKEATVTSSNIVALAYVVPVFEVDDGFVPDLPMNMVPMMQTILNNASMSAFKQTEDGNSVRRETQQTAQARRKHGRIQERKYFNAGFGRK